jgi:hypothetical protein
MKNTNTKFNADVVSAPETTNAIEVAQTETHDISLALPEGLDLAAMLERASALDKAEVGLSLKADYLELNSGQSFRGIFMGYGTAKHKSPNEGEGLVEKVCIKLLGSDKKGYINSSVLLVREFEQAGVPVGTAVQITMTGQKTMPNGFKAKEYDVALLA